MFEVPNAGHTPSEESEDSHQVEAIRNAALDRAARETEGSLEKTAKAILGKKILEDIDDSAVDADRTALNALRAKGKGGETAPSTRGIEVTEEHGTIQ